MRAFRGRPRQRLQARPRRHSCVVREGRVVGRAGPSPVAARTRRDQSPAAPAAAQCRAYVRLEPRTPAAAPACVMRRSLPAWRCSGWWWHRRSDPRVAGRGIARLSRITVETGLCEAEARALNAGFLRRVTGDCACPLKLAPPWMGGSRRAKGKPLDHRRGSAARCLPARHPHDTCVAVDQRHQC